MKLFAHHFTWIGAPYGTSKISITSFLFDTIHTTRVGDIYMIILPINDINFTSWETHNFRKSDNTKNIVFQEVISIICDTSAKYCLRVRTVDQYRELFRRLSCFSSPKVWKLTVRIIPIWWTAAPGMTNSVTKQAAITKPAAVIIVAVS